MRDAKLHRILRFRMGFITSQLRRPAILTCLRTVVSATYAILEH